MGSTVSKTAPTASKETSPVLFGKEWGLGVTGAFLHSESGKKSGIPFCALPSIPGIAPGVAPILVVFALLKS